LIFFSQRKINDLSSLSLPLSLLLVSLSLSPSLSPKNTGKAKARDHIVRGLLIAMESMDKVVATVRSAPDAAAASARLISDHGLSELQAEAVLAMALRRLTSLEADKLNKESEELSARITDLDALLASPERVADTLVREAEEVALKFGDDRRTALRLGDDGSVDDEALVPEGESIVVFSKRGFVKRMPADTFSQQARGTRGKLGATPRGEGDGVGDVLAASNRDTLLFFTREGGVFSLRVHAIPEASRGAAGTAIPKLISVDRGDGFAAMLAVRDFSAGEQGLLLLTRNGLVKRTALDQFAKVRRTGITAIGMREGAGDELTWVARAPAGSRVLLAASNGAALLFATDSLRPTGRASTGVNAMKLAPGAKLVGMCVLPPPPGYVPKKGSSGGADDGSGDSSKDEGEGDGDEVDVDEGAGAAAAAADDDGSVLFVTKKGMGKRVPLSAFRNMRRNCVGVRAIKMAEGDELAALLPVPGGAVGGPGGSPTAAARSRRRADAASASASAGSRDLLVGTASGVMLRLAQADIPASGRSAKGVRVVRLAEGDAVASVTAMSGEGEGETTDDEGGSVGGGNGVAGASAAAAGRRSPSAASAAASSSASESPAPARPGTGRKTSYMTFCDSLREQVKAELLEQGGGDAAAAKMTNVSRELAKRWRELSEAEKASWQEAAKQG
jgi:DNA gyrase subunit A